MPTDNLLDTLGAEKTGDVDSVKKEGQGASDITDGDGGTPKPAVKAEPVDDTGSAADTKSAQDSDDPYADYSKDDAVEELKKARAEAAKRRVELKNVEEQFSARLQEELTKVEDRMAPLAKKADELDKVKADQEDKKRSLEEKVAHRERLLEQRDEELNAIKAEKEQEMKDARAKANELQAIVDAHESYYKDQLDKEIEAVPQKHRKLADMIVKGAEGTKEALNALREAKSDNLFGAKKVVVNHSVPGAETGARTDSAKLKQTEKDKMTVKDKYKAGLKDLEQNLKNTKGGRIL